LVAPRVSTTAATAAIRGPGAPMARLSRPASGTSVAARGPRTLIVATARPRYSAVVTPRAMATARGSCRPGSAKRVVSGATASQPTNENISVVAALPTESQPCGENGAQLAARAAAAEPVTATTTTAVSRLTRTTCAVALARRPPAARPMTVSSSTAVTAARANWPPPVRSVT
jgi:hypothetical protein